MLAGRKVMAQNPYQSPNEAHRSQSANAGELRRDITLRGSMPVRDVLHTQLLILSRRWHYALFCLCMYVVFVVALGMLDPAESIFGNTFTVLGLIVMPAILPFTLLMVYLRLSGDARRQVGVFAFTETNLSTEGIESTLNGESVSIPWSSFNSFMHSQRVVLLFLRESNNHLIVSRAKLTEPDDWSQFLEFLHDRFPSR